MSDQPGPPPPASRPAAGLTGLHQSASAPTRPSPGIEVEFWGVDANNHAVRSTTSIAPARRPAGIDVELSKTAPPERFQSPLRQHRRTPSAHREVKETLNARYEYTSDQLDGRSHHRINQYVIEQEIGRGSYGAVHLCRDQFGAEFAVKEFSKARLRKRAQSNILRHGPLRRFPGRGLNGPAKSPLLSSHAEAEAKDALYLIRQEVAIMKKLNHPNLVQLIEVLDDPDEDSLYMVLELCKNGVVMKVGLDTHARPYSEETCRCWFRDLILGIEYLHAQGVVHRDIKPDNLLLTHDDVLKIVDFGVSEMFQRADEMMTAKSAGSPAFLPPELCVAKHGDISGTAADIWSMGVSLFCLRYGRIPFEQQSVLDMYEAIRNEPIPLPAGESDEFLDLMSRLLDKDPVSRVKMSQLRDHPWVTKNGADPLLSAEENCATLIEAPNALEVNHAFTRKMNLFYVMKAIAKFKSLIGSKTLRHRGRSRPRPLPEGMAKGEKSAGDSDMLTPKARSPGPDETERQAQISQIRALVEQRKRYKSGDSIGPRKRGEPFGLALNTSRSHQPLLWPGDAEVGRYDDDDDVNVPGRFLGVGVGGLDDFSGAPESTTPPAGVVSDSPTAVDFSVYDRAYAAEVERIRTQTQAAADSDGPTKLFLTRHIDNREPYREGRVGVAAPDRRAAPAQGHADSAERAARHAARKGSLADIVLAMKSMGQPQAPHASKPS